MNNAEVMIYENPFFAQRLRPGTIDYIFPAGGSAAELAGVLRRNRWRGQIIGPHGTGKSTLLVGLLAELRSRGHRVVHVELHDGQRSCPEVFITVRRDVDSDHSLAKYRRPNNRKNITAERDEYGREPYSPPTIVAIDGYEQLNLWNRWKLAWFCRRRGYGLVVTAHRNAGFVTLFETRIDITLAWQVVERLQQGHGELVCPDDCFYALQRRHGNLREALFDLYDIYESQLQSYPRRLEGTSVRSIH